MATYLVISQKESSQEIKFPAMDLLEIALLLMPTLGILETLFLNQPLILLILLRWCNTPHNFMVHNIHKLNHSFLCHSHSTLHLNALSHKLNVNSCFLSSLLRITRMFSDIKQLLWWALLLPKPTFVNNFSSNPFWSPLSLAHSIFPAHIVDRHTYKTFEWIIDTSAT